MPYPKFNETDLRAFKCRIIGVAAAFGAVFLALLVVAIINHVIGV